MPYIVDIGGAPANEPCAQLGQTQHFDLLNKLEVLAYKYAIIARYGEPPAGCRLSGLANRHDFGTYTTLVLHVENELDEAVADYAERVEEGLGTWLEAGFRAPVTYDDATAIEIRDDPIELLVGALHVTRPGPDGRFPIPDFETLHRNLTAAFPGEAEIARARLTEAATA